MMTTSTLRRMKQSIKAYNKYMPEAYLETLSPVSLLRFCHPTDRKEYALSLIKDGLVERSEVISFLNE